jgi:hypothetical protein
MRHRVHYKAHEELFCKRSYYRQIAVGCRLPVAGRTSQISRLMSKIERLRSKVVHQRQLD